MKHCWLKMVQPFGKCWRSKLEIRPGCTEVDGFVDPDMIANNFAEYFSGIYAPNNDQRAATLYNEYVKITLAILFHLTVFLTLKL